MQEFNKRNARTWSRLGLMGAFGAISLPDLRKDQPDVFLVSADIYGLDRFFNTYPESSCNVGITEQNMIGISSGLASEGNCVFAITYASFLTSRAHEFIRQDLGYLRYNVKLVGFNAGISAGTSGVAHWAIDDIALMRSIPNMTVLSPADAMEAVKMCEAVAKTERPVYIRLCGNKNTPIIYDEDYDFQIGKAVALRNGTDVAIIATGLLVKDSLEAAVLLEKEGISCAVYDMHTIKPLDTELLEAVYKKFRFIATVEEHNVIGGLGSAIAEHKAQFANAPRQILLGIDDSYKKTGTRAFAMEEYGLTAVGIAESIRKRLGGSDLQD